MEPTRGIIYGKYGACKRHNILSLQEARRCWSLNGVARAIKWRCSSHKKGLEPQNGCCGKYGDATR